MKKKVILTAVIIGALSELAAVIYTIHIRSNAVIGGEYFILPLFIMAAYCVLEIIGTGESNKKTAVRLTRRTKYGDAVLNHEVFPEYAEETLIHEVNCFEPMKTAVEKLCEYEEMGGN